MPGARLEVVLDPHPDGFGAERRRGGRAADRAEPGDRPGAAARRRLRRRALAGDARPQRPRRRRARTMVFDEIDAGIGGKTARVVGERLRALGEGRQVICITHLPQVASLAAIHFRLEKDLDGEPGDGERRAPRRRGRGRGDPPHARRRRLRRGGDPPRSRAPRRRLSHLVYRLPERLIWTRGHRQPSSPACAALTAKRRVLRDEALEGVARLGRTHQGPGQAADPRRRRRHRPPQHRPDRRRGADRHRRAGRDQRLAVLQRPLPERRAAAARPGRGGADRRRRGRPLRVAARGRPGQHRAAGRSASAARPSSAAGCSARSSSSASSTTSGSGSTRRWPSSPRTPSPTSAARPTC